MTAPLMTGPMFELEPLQPAYKGDPGAALLLVRCGFLGSGELRVSIEREDGLRLLELLRLWLEGPAL